MDGASQSLVSYRLRTVRVGVLTQLLVLAALLAFVLIPSSVEFEDKVLYVGVLVTGAAGAIVVSLLPWGRLFATGKGMLAMYAWSVVDILLIAALIALTGGDDSPLFLLFGFTSVFFAASYPPRAQIVLLLFTFFIYTVTIVLVDDHIVAATFTLSFSILALLTLITSFLSRELMEQNATLQAEITRHKATETQLRQSEAELEEAQDIARLGSWSWDVRANRITWSDQLFRMYGLRREDFPGDYDTFLMSVHEDDRERLNAAVERALEEGSSFAVEHKIVRPDGEVRIHHARGRVELVDGQPLRMVGTAHDITDRKKSEETERRIQELQLKQQQAVEINDNVVQGLAIASYALDGGQVERARLAVRKTLDAARSIVNGLLDIDSLKPGDLVRSRAANVIADDQEADGNEAPNRPT